MAADLTRGERLQIMLTPKEIEALDNWRFARRMPSRAAAVRELLKRGLGGESIDTTVQVTVKPTALASTNSPALFAGLFGIGLLGLIGIRRKDGRFHPLLALLALPLILTGCGGGGGSSGGGGGTTPTPVSTTYTGILTATSVMDPTVTTSAPFTVTITKTS